MKKILTLIIAILFSINVNAQCGVNQAVDFTATDHLGNQISLSEILGRGQYVLIDFFYNACGPCQNIAPYIVDSYYELGCNQHDVFYIGISPNDNNEVCQTWCDSHGVEYPIIGIEGGGATICSQYQVAAYPTVILISPSTYILRKDISPINSTQSIVDVLTSYNIDEYYCGTTSEPSVEIALGEISSTTIEATFTPNEDCASYYIMLGIASEMDQWINMMGATLEQLVQMWGVEETGVYTYTWTEQVPDTEYTIYALPLDAQGNAGEIVTQIATTESAGGTGTSVIELTVEVLSETSVKTVAVPNEETAEYHYGLIEKAYFEEVGEETAIQMIREDGYPLFETDEWVWIELMPSTDYYAIATGKNGVGEWGETTIVPFSTSLESVNEIETNTFNIYPNPATTMLYFETEMRGEAEVSIIDVVGRNVMNVNVSEVNKASVNIENLKEGIYFVKIQTADKCSIEKIVVK